MKRSHKMFSDQYDSRPNPVEDDMDISDASTVVLDETRTKLSSEESHIPGPTLSRKIMDVVTVLHINMFLYSTCFWIQTGVLPYLTRSLKLDTVAFGYLQTTFHIVQLIGGPLFGRFADVYGGRMALICAFTSAGLMYGMLGASTSAVGVFLSRIPSLFLHAFHGTQMVIVDVTEPSQRASALGRISLSYGLGIVVGPLIGGQVATRFSEQSSAFVACAGSILSVLIIIKWIPANTKRTVDTKQVKEETKSLGKIFNLSKIISLLKNSPGAIFFLFLMLICGAPQNLFHSMLSVITMESFKLTSEETGFILSFTGLISMLVQGIGIGILTKKFNDSVILNGSIIILFISYLLLCFVSTTTHLVVVLVLLTCGHGVIDTVLMSSLTKTVTVTDTGTMLGLGHACRSLVSTLAPTIGAYLLENFGIASFGVIGSVVYTLLLLVPKN